MKKAAAAVTIIFEIILVITAFQAILLGSAKMIWLTFLNMICLLLPFLVVSVASKRKLFMPGYFRLGSVLFIIMAQYLGEIKKFYSMFWWWDIMLHGIFGAFSAAVILSILGRYGDKEGNGPEKYSAAEQAFISFCVTLTIGTLWEIFEFMGDYFFKTTMVKGGLEDTMSDLMIKIAAALITVTGFYFWNTADAKRSKGP